jgi:hypothetical protein
MPKYAIKVTNIQSRKLVTLTILPLLMYLNMPCSIQVRIFTEHPKVYSGSSHHYIIYLWSQLTNPCLKVTFRWAPKYAKVH